MSYETETYDDAGLECEPFSQPHGSGYFYSAAAEDDAVQAADYMEQQLTKLEEAGVAFASRQERSSAAWRINPGTARTVFLYRRYVGPYGGLSDSLRYQTVGDYFVFDPADRLLVWLGDLPYHTALQLISQLKETPGRI
jgi:hypothetical protein